MQRLTPFSFAVFGWQSWSCMHVGLGSLMFTTFVTALYLPSIEGDEARRQKIMLEARKQVRSFVLSLIL